MAADLNSFRMAMQRLGLNQPSSLAFTNDGITSIEDLLLLEPKNVNDIVSTVAKTHQGEDNIAFPVGFRIRLAAIVWWALRRNATNDAMNPAMITAELAQQQADLMKREKEREKNLGDVLDEPEPLIKGTDWPEFERSFIAYSNKKRLTYGAPMAYLLRDDDAPAPVTQEFASEEE